MLSFTYFEILFHYAKIQSEARSRKGKLKQSLIIIKTLFSFCPLTCLLTYSYKMSQRDIVGGKNVVTSTVFFPMLEIPWLFTGESDELLSP